jgi:predicted amidohydrolase YtcJ
MKRKGSTLKLLTLLLASSVAACQPAGPEAPATRTADTADLIVVNGKVFAADEAGTTAEAVAVRGTTIERIGTSAEIEKLRGPETRVVDARGGSIVPGFNDAHVHFVGGGFALGQVDLAGLNTLREVQAAISTFASQHPGTGWLRGRGWLYAPFPGGSPTRSQLDEVLPDRPAMMSCYDGHSVWVNSKALELAGITKDTPNPPNGEIVKDPRTGEPTGHLKESAADLMDPVLPKPTEEDTRAALKAAVAQANQFGVTSIQNAGGSIDEIARFEAAKHDGSLTVRTYLAFSANAATTEADADRMVETWKRLGEDPFVRSGIVKMFADGVIESRTAAMLAPYANSTTAGAPNLSPDDLKRVVAMLDKRGLQVQIHAIGDRAIRMSLDALEHAASVNPAPARGRRHRLEHIEAVAEDDIARFGRLGIIASQQPMHVVLGDMNQPKPAGPWPDNVGPERFARAWAWRRIMAGGGRIAFGSDWPVATLDPGPGIWLAATRVTLPGGTEQAMPMADVIRGYTAWPAYASFEDQRKGTLAPGMLADIAVLTTDVFTGPPARPSDAVVQATIFDGRVVYSRPSPDR